MFNTPKGALLVVSLVVGGLACPGPSAMSVQGVAIVPPDVIAAAIPGRRHALFGSYQQDGWQQPRPSERAIVLCGDLLPTDIPFWIGFLEGCGAPGVIRLVLSEIRPGPDDPCKSPVMGVRADLKPLTGIQPQGNPLATGTARVFGNQQPTCAEHGDDRREDAGMVPLTR